MYTIFVWWLWSTVITFLKHYLNLINFRCYNNAYYAKIGGITTEEMNLLELDFLFGIGFQLNVTLSTYNNYCSSLQREMVMRNMYSPLLEPSFLTLKSLQISLYDEDSLSIHQNKQLTTAVWYIGSFVILCNLVLKDMLQHFWRL